MYIQTSITYRKATSKYIDAIYYSLKKLSAASAGVHKCRMCACLCNAARTHVTHSSSSSGGCCVLDLACPAALMSMFNDTFTFQRIPAHVRASPNAPHTSIVTVRSFSYIFSAKLCD